MSNNTMDPLIRMLDAADLQPGAQELRARTYDLLELAPGTSVVDVGCGAGRAVNEMSERGVQAIGVDLSEEMISVARARWSHAEFHVADAYALPFGDAVMAGYRADKVFHDLADVPEALGEAARVLAPGGRIVLLGQDWDTFVIDSDHPELTRTIVQARADMVANPRAARRYRNVLIEAGFTDVRVEVHTGVFSDAAMLPILTGIAEAAFSVGAVSREERDVWVEDQRERAGQSRMFLALPLFLAAARRR
ncbi:methyltransferase domain-containing protein [Microtetraspora malaysiensis]|uniref:methyltransferase domain-containing protein n=1 Tax=Microtetraspora malaysiensis TaxID=161358 RepID=UPI003D92617D